MYAEFGSGVPNTRVMVPELTLTSAAELKRGLLELPGVSAVMWLDDVEDLSTPVELMDEATVEQYWRDGTAMYDVTIDEGMESEAVKAIYALTDDKAAIGGNAASTASMQNLVVSEVVGRGARARAHNHNPAAPHDDELDKPDTLPAHDRRRRAHKHGYERLLRRDKLRHAEREPHHAARRLARLRYLPAQQLRPPPRGGGRTSEEAMRLAIKESFSSIAASAATTLFGFMALMFMRFGIGSDLGVNLVKGIVLSYVSVMVFLPALSLACVKWLDRSTHKPIIHRASAWARSSSPSGYRRSYSCCSWSCPATLAQTRADFLYGNGEPDTRTDYGAPTRR